MKSTYVVAIAAAVMAVPSHAGILTLENVVANGPNDFTFNYQATLGPDEGVRSGDRFIIFDFAGYIPGSIFSASADFATSTPNTSPGAIVTPGHNDDANIANLTFVYTGPDFRVSGGPFPEFDFPLFSARSRFSTFGLDAFFSYSTKNNSVASSPLYTLGSITVPRPAAVPEPASWALMIAGFGLTGGLLRSRRPVLSRSVR